MSARIPVVVVTGTSPEALARVTVGLQWELPGAVVVEHRIDVHEQRLHRTVSDIDGLVEQAVIELEHACVDCAVREDVVPTLGRLAASGRWEAIVAHLPVGAEASHVCRSARTGEADLRSVRIAGVVAAVEGGRTLQDLLGDDLLAERGLHSSVEDRRGVGEVLASMVEYADLVAFAGDGDPTEHELVRALARPDAVVLDDASHFDGRHLLAGLHHARRTESWAALVQPESLPTGSSEHVWTLQLSSDRPFHPERLMANLPVLGGGPRRSRGCFWLPTRPGQIVGCGGAGGQFGIGLTGSWGARTPFTRILVTGLDDGRPELVTAFEDALLTGDEISRHGRRWDAHDDGLEPWLGGIRRAA